METISQKNAMFLTSLSIGVIFPAGFASPAHPGLANAQQNKTLMQPQVVQGTIARRICLHKPSDVRRILCSTEADIMAVVQKPINISIFAEKSGPPVWKQLPTWYQVSELIISYHIQEQVSFRYE